MVNVDPVLLAEAYNLVKETKVGKGEHTFDNFDKCANCRILIPQVYEVLSARRIQYPFPLAIMAPEAFAPIYLN